MAFGFGFRLNEVRPLRVLGATTGPLFATAPSLSPKTGDIGTVFTGVDATASSGTVTGRQWYLDGQPIAGQTGSTYTSTGPGRVQFASIATRNGQTAILLSGDAIVAASAVATIYNTPISSSLTIAQVQGAQAIADAQDARIRAIITSFDPATPTPTIYNTPIDSTLTLGQVDGALSLANSLDARIAAIIASFDPGFTPTMASTPISSSLTLGQVPGLLAKANEHDARLAAIVASFNPAGQMDFSQSQNSGLVSVI